MSDRLIGKDLKVLGQKTHGYFGDPTGYEEVLLETTESSYILLGQGGYQSKYPHATLRQLTQLKAYKWLVALLGEEAAGKLIKIKRRKKTAKATKTTKPIKSTGNLTSQN